MIGRKLLSALLVAGGMMSVLAFGAGSANADDKAAVKELPLKDGKIEIVNSVRYASAAEDLAHSGSVSVNLKVEKLTAAGPSLELKPFSVRDGENVKDEGTRTVERVNKLELPLADKFSNVKSGCYEYKISETFTDGDGKPLKDFHGYQVSSAVYHLRVYVSTDVDGSHKIHAVTAELGGVKVDKLEFKSLCCREGAVNIDLTGIGDFVDRNKLVECVFKLKKAPVILDRQKEMNDYGVILRVNGKEVDNLKFDDKGTVTVSAKICGGRVNLEMPAGTEYCIYAKEHKDGYTPKCKMSGEESFRMGEDKEYDFTITNASDDISQMRVMGPNAVLFDFVHTYDDRVIPVTGLSLDDCTGLMMAVVALGSIAALGVVTVVIRKKFTDR